MNSNFNFERAFASPDWFSPLGYDAYGFFLHERIWQGLIYSLSLALSISILSFIIALFFSFLLTQISKTKRSVLLGILDTFISMPWLVMILFLAALVGSSKLFSVLWVSLLISSVPFKIRFSYNLMQKLEKSSYLESIKALGFSNFRILWKYYFPNIKPYFIPLISWSMSSIILTEATLSFLGLGDPLQNPSLGKMLVEGKWYLIEAPHLLVFPTIVLLFVICFFNFLAHSRKDF